MAHTLKTISRLLQRFFHWKDRRGMPGNDGLSGDVCVSASGEERFLYHGEYKGEKRISFLYTEYKLTYDGTVSYEYVYNPDTKSERTRLYDGMFVFSGRCKGDFEIKSARGRFRKDLQVGKWEYSFKIRSVLYSVNIEFNDAGEIDGVFNVFVGKIKSDSESLYSGEVRNKYIYRLNFNGIYFERHIVIRNGRYGTGNGHPAHTWNMELVNDPSPHKGGTPVLGHLKKGSYVIQYAETDRGNHSQWGRVDNWAIDNEYGKCYYVDSSTGNRLDAGSDITRIPFELNEEAAGILNAVLMRQSKGVNRHCNAYERNGTVYPLDY